MTERCRHGEPVFVCRTCTLVDVPPEPDPEPVTGPDRELSRWIAVTCAAALFAGVLLLAITRSR